MKLIMELMELALYDIVQIATVALELFGIAVLVFTAVKCFIRWLRKDHENIRLELAQGIALALEFKMGGEVLRTVVVREWSELGILGAIIVLRAMLTSDLGKLGMKKGSKRTAGTAGHIRSKKGKGSEKESFPFFDVCFAEHISNGYFEWVQAPDPPCQLEVGV